MSWFKHCCKQSIVFMLGGWRRSKLLLPGVSNFCTYRSQASNSHKISLISEKRKLTTRAIVKVLISKFKSSRLFILLSFCKHLTLILKIQQIQNGLYHDFSYVWIRNFLPPIRITILLSCDSNKEKQQKGKARTIQEYCLSKISNHKEVVFYGSPFKCRCNFTTIMLNAKSSQHLFSIKQYFQIHCQRYQHGAIISGKFSRYHH